MRRRLRSFGNACALALVAVVANSQRPVQSVDIFLGSGGGRNVFVGATLPFGMVKAGAMSSRLLFGELGIYPNAEQDVYLIGSPKFARSTIFLGNGKTFVIEAEGVDDKHCYVTSAELNGKRLDSAWFRHADIANGGRLVLHMSTSPGAWPSDNPPPSASDAQWKLQA